MSDEHERRAREVEERSVRRPTKRRVRMALSIWGKERSSHDGSGQELDKLLSGLDVNDVKVR